MNTSLSAFKGQLPSVSKLVEALAAVKAEVSQGDVCFLKMDKTGHWLYGAEGVEVDKKSEWAVNPYSFIHGFIAWGQDANVLGEKMTPLTDALPEIGAAPEGAKQGWQKQMGFNLRCVAGADEGVDAIYKVTTMGGLKALGELALSVAMQINKEPDAPIAIATLKSDFYMNKDKTVGRTYFPIFEVLDFIAIPEEGEEAPDVEEAPEPKRIAPAKVEAPAPAPRRVITVAPALFEPDEETAYEEVPAEEAPAPRRRMRR
jgi:hypothetical protein